MLLGDEPAIILERAVMPLTLNVAKQSKQLWKIRTELEEWRKWAYAEAFPHFKAQRKKPLVGPVRVTSFHLRPNRASMPDVGAPILATKAVIDGVVEAGALPNDKPETVTELVFTVPRIVGYHGLRVVIEWL